VHIDYSLNFNHHILVLEKKSIFALGVICKLKHFLQEKTLVTIYYTLVHPYLTYGILNWATTFNLHLKKLQVLQNKCLRIIEGWRIKLAPFYLKNEMLNFNQLLKFEIAKFMHRYWNGKLPDVFNDYFQLVKTISSYSLRSLEKNDFCLPLVRTKRAQKSIKFLGPKIWNEISISVRNLPFRKFKAKYKLCLSYDTYS